MAQINFNKVLRDYNGNEIINEATEEKQTFKDVVGVRLYSSGENLTPDEKYEAYKLMNRIISAGDSIEIEDKDSVLIKKVCEKTMTSGGYGQIVELLNSNI